ncbi:MAG: hypothetical protein D6689_07335 [Deltaproteobacteria bacterium]|nr:MAG: hypothetical protein D6689_07335 [Deltaproteobacteria bacterium]
MTSNRRRAPRHETLLHVALHVAAKRAPADGVRGVVSSLSRSGLFCATPARAAVGQTVRFAFTSPDGVACEAVGFVIENRGELGFAVEFQGETREMKAFFDRVERLSADERWALLQSIDDGVIEIV